MSIFLYGVINWGVSVTSSTLEKAFMKLWGNCFKSLTFKFKFCSSSNLWGEISRKQKRATIYGCASLVSDFKVTRENDDLLHKNTNKFLTYRILCASILKCWFPTKGIKLTRFVHFKVAGVPQLWFSSV